LSIFLQGARQSIRICAKQEHTHKIRPPCLGLYYLFRKMEGVRTENFIRIRNYCFLSESSSVYGTESKMGTDPDFLFSFFADPDYGTGTYSVFYQHLNNLFSANFLFVFCRIFAGKVTVFYRKRALKFILLCSVKARVERVGRPPRPLPASRTSSGVWAGGHGGHTRFLQEAGGR